jgi:hypothetical protein
MNQQPNRYAGLLPVLVGAIVGFALIRVTGRRRITQRGADPHDTPHASGVRHARATVISIWPTGQLLSGDAVLRLLLEVRRSGQAPYRTEIECAVAHGRIAQLHAGATVPVCIDAANGVRIDWT